MPRLGRALWKGCCWLPVVAVFHYCLWAPFFQQNSVWIHCDLLWKIVFAIIQYTIQSVLLDNYHKFHRVTCIKENILSLAFNIDANESILGGKQQNPINRKPPPLILRCGISTALLTCFQTMPPFAGTALGYPVSLAVCISCFASHEEGRVTSSVSVVRCLGTIQTCDILTAI